MKLRTGLKALIGLSILGIGVAIFLIYTCPFAGQITFSTLVRQMPMGHSPHQGEHFQQPSGKTQEPHKGKGEGSEGPGGHSEVAQRPHGAETKHPEKGEEFMVGAMAVPGVRTYTVKETKLFGVEVSVLGIGVLLLLLVLCFLILRQRPLGLLGHKVTPTALGIIVSLMTLWNLVFAAFLVGVEVIQLKEL
jgi:hypothetical protein